MSARVSSLKYVPCSMECTPARTAPRAPSSPCACAATGKPALRASSTIAAISSSVKVRLRGVRLWRARALGRQNLNQVHMVFREEPHHASQIVRPSKAGHELVHARKIKEEVAVPLGKVGTNLVP